MANPNPDVWGAPETWSNAKIQTITTSSLADTLKCGAVKIANFGGTDNVKRGSLARGMAASKITPQQGIDKTVCPCGQDSNVSAFGKIAIINENSELSGTPTRIIERDNNINWCFCELQEDTLSIPNHFTFIKTFNWSNYDNKGLDQFAPDATYNDYNKSEWQVPYLSYQINSLVLGIQVYCITEETASNLSATWRYLDDWKNNYNTQPICGLRVVVMGVNTIDTSTLTLVYDNNTDKAQYSNSGMICVLDTIDTPDRNGAVVDTSFYGICSYGDRGACGYLFMPTYISKAVYTGVFPAWEMFSGQQLKRHSVTEYSATYYYSIPYSDDNYNAIMKMVACFGCYFTPTNKYQFAHTMTDNDLYLPIIDDDGVTHGEYTHGADNVNNDLYVLGSIREKDYDPTKPPTPIDPNTYSNTTVFNVIGAGASMNKRYLLNAENVSKLSTDLFDICDDMSTGDDYSFFDSKVKANMLTQSPIDSIVSLIRYPFTPTHGGTKQPVKLGRFEASAEGYPISNAIQTITFAGVDIFPRFGNNFLDYEPYTKYEVYVPFCDTVELSAADILGHTLNVRLVVDLFTGVCTGYILADNLCIETTSGNVGVSLPLTGLDTATINANIANAEANKKAAKKNYIKGHFDIITQKDKVGALWTQILGTNEDVVKKADYDLKHIETPMHTIGAASPLTSWAMDLNARVIIYYPTGDAITDNTPPKLRDLTTYGHTTGFATIDNAQLSKYTGFTVATNPILNFAATKTEKEMIESALNGGIFI